MDENLEAIAERAFEWVVLLETATPAEREEFIAWVRASPMRMREALNAVTIIEDVRQQRSSLNLRPIPAPRGEFTDRYHRRLVWSYLVAACCVVAVVGGLFLALTAHSPEKLITAYEWRTQRLSDGTVVQAAPHTELTIDYSKETRGIRLVHGRAMFDVAKNPTRPFIVAAAFATARAVGTRFAVSAEGEEEAVTVDEGIVTVKRVDDRHGSDAAVTLRAGSEVRVKREGDLSVHTVDLDAVLAWTRHRLVFDRQTVAEAVQEFNQYNRAQIILRHPALAKKIVTGVMPADDPELFARFLESQGGTAIIHEGADTLVLIPSAHDSQ